MRCCSAPHKHAAFLAAAQALLGRGGVPAVVVAVLLLSVPFAGWSMGVSVLAMGLILAVAVAHHVWSTNRPAAQPGQPAAQPAA